MEENIQNNSPTVMFRGTPCIWKFNILGLGSGRQLSLGGEAGGVLTTPPPSHAAINSLSIL